MLATVASVTAAIIPIGVAGKDLTQAIVSAIDGGKRLRSMLLLASHAANRGRVEHAAVCLGASLELFHTAALLHDDVIDASETRRGKPATHRVFAAEHQANNWVGDPNAFGFASAILTGDIALLASGRALHSAMAQLEDGPRDRVATIYHNTVDLVSAGQYLDMRLAAQPIDSISDLEAGIRATIRAKTASYTCEAPLAMGAVAAGASEDTVSRLRSIGVLMGVCFQLRDDILGLVGSPQATGKPVGDDIREGKRTLLLWHAWNQASPSQRTTLRRVVGNRASSGGEIDAAIAIIEAVGAFDAVEKEIAETALQARDGIRDLGLSEPFASILDDAAASAANRER
jgi:geranylgeranyl diphosphate synthase type I